MGELMDKAKGRAKQAVGAAAADRSMQAEGKAQETRGKVKGKFEEGKQRIKDEMRQNRSQRG